MVRVAPPRYRHSFFSGTAAIDVADAERCEKRSDALSQGGRTVRLPGM